MLFRSAGGADALVGAESILGVPCGEGAAFLVLVAGGVGKFRIHADLPSLDGAETELGELGAAAVPVAWKFVLHDYQKARVMTFLNPESDMLGAGWNITQAKIAVGSGGAAGKGFLQGTQSRLNFLPEKQTDFIFTVLGEEFGLIGLMFLMGLYLLLLMQGVNIAMDTRSQFGRLVAMGVCLNFLLYILINTSMSMGLIPVVGIPLPLVSYGGTALMTVLLGFGLLLSVQVHRNVEIPRGA